MNSFLRVDDNLYTLLSGHVYFWCLDPEINTQNEYRSISVFYIHYPLDTQINYRRYVFALIAIFHDQRLFFLQKV